MIEDGQIVLFTFPQTDQSIGKLRPALVLRSLPGAYDDWLICMISTRVHEQVSEVDEVIRDSDADFPQSGLKVTSLVRVTRVAAAIFAGEKGSLLGLCFVFGRIVNTPPTARPGWMRGPTRTS